MCLLNLKLTDFQLARPLQSPPTLAPPVLSATPSLICPLPTKLRRPSKSSPENSSLSARCPFNWHVSLKLLPRSRPLPQAGLRVVEEKEPVVELQAVAAVVVVVAVAAQFVVGVAWALIFLRENTETNTLSHSVKQMQQRIQMSLVKCFLWPKPRIKLPPQNQPLMEKQNLADLVSPVSADRRRMVSLQRTRLWLPISLTTSARRRYESTFFLLPLVQERAHSFLAQRTFRCI